MRITVVGDVLLDEDLVGTVDRLCPDAPVPVVDVVERRSRAGGAGLVATLLRRDGHEVALVTALSQDDGAERIREHLNGVAIVEGRSDAPTPIKTRLRTVSQSVCRVDEGCASPPVPCVDSRMLEAIADAEAIVVADYGRRLTAHPDLRAALQRRATDVPLVWDPHPKGAQPVRTARLVTPNLAEAAALAGTRASVSAAATAAARLRDRFDCDGVLVTLGGHGALLQERGGDATRIPTAAVETSDPCGAGDRLAAAAIAELAAGADSVQAARTAVRAARDFLAAGGVTALHAPVALAPVATASDPLAVAVRVRAAGGVVVAAGGCFDLLHAGHVRMLQAARALGDCLIVCMNSDASVRRLKGAGRPIIGEDDRIEMLRALDCVDAVLVFSEDTPESTLERLRPDYWVKGGDYAPAAIPESRLINSWGGSCITLPFHLGRSTTRLAAALEQVG